MGKELCLWNYRYIFLSSITELKLIAMFLEGGGCLQAYSYDGTFNQREFVRDALYDRLSPKFSPILECENLDIIGIRLASHAEIDEGGLWNSIQQRSHRVVLRPPVIQLKELR